MELIIMTKEIKDFVKNYWKYYLRLEAEFIHTLKYVEFSKDNYKTYSLEYLRLYLAVCSEIDVMGKVFAKKRNPNFDGSKANIQKWWYEIQTVHTANGLALNMQEVHFLDIESFKPWENYAIERYNNRKGSICYKLSTSINAQTPFWWTQYNKVKHERTQQKEEGGTNYNNANLKNLSRAFGALFILENTFLNKYTVKEDFSKIEESHLFSI